MRVCVRCVCVCVRCVCNACACVCTSEEDEVAVLDVLGLQPDETGQVWGLAGGQVTLVVR